MSVPLRVNMENIDDLTVEQHLIESLKQQVVELKKKLEDQKKNKKRRIEVEVAKKLAKDEATPWILFGQFILWYIWIHLLGLLHLILYPKLFSRLL